MKKCFLTTAVAVFFLFFVNGVQAQTLLKGNVLGFHGVSVTLKPGVTNAQYEAFCKDKLFPAYEKNMPGTKCFLLKGKRGECKDCYGFLIIFPSEAARDKIWKEDNSYTELGQKMVDALKPLLDEDAKMVTYTDKYTDWIVQ
jgi:hypothetical protein